MHGFKGHQDILLFARIIVSFIALTVVTGFSDISKPKTHSTGPVNSLTNS